MLVFKLFTEESSIPAKKKGWLLKKKTREVLLEGGGVPNMPGMTRSEVMPSGRKHCEEWHCQSETSFLPFGSVHLPAVIDFSLFKYKDCKAQHDSAPIGGASSVSYRPRLIVLCKQSAGLGNEPATYRLCSSLFSHGDTCLKPAQ